MTTIPAAPPRNTEPERLPRRIRLPASPDLTPGPGDHDRADLVATTRHFS
jgi:hypothetical protein